MQGEIDTSNPSKNEEDYKAKYADMSEEDLEKYCPYFKAKGLFSNIFKGKESNPKKVVNSNTIQDHQNEINTSKKTSSNQKNKSSNLNDISTKLDTSLTDSDLETGGKCPFGYTEKDIEDNQKGKNNGDIPEGKCPFGYTSSDKKDKDKEKNKKQNDSDDDDSEDDQPKGGCPVMKKGMKDPENKHYEQYYEIPFFGTYDFLFLMRGGLETEEWLNKTEKLRKYPRHLRSTLFFQAQEKLIKVHEFEFPKVFFIYDDIKQKAKKFFKKKKYKEAIEHMTYAYGLLKWIQFKDKERQKNFIVKPSLDPILDDDLEEKHVYLDDVKVEEDSFKACVVFLLEIMAYAHMELRQYSCAVECLDECAEIAEDKVGDVYFRRSQARTYNRDSTDKDLELAMEDIEHAIKIKPEKIYKEHKEILEKIMNERNQEKIEKIRTLITKANRKMNKAKDQNLNLDEIFFVTNEDSDKQYKILKEMRSKYNMAVKFFNETKNDEQLALTYKEFESFHKSFEEFKFFYKLKINELDPKVLNQLTEEEKNLINNEEFIKYIDEYRYKMCEDVFGNGNFNIELFTYCLEKVFSDERKEQEEKEKQEALLHPKPTWGEWFMNITKSKFTIYASLIFIMFTIGAIAFSYFSYSSSPLGKMPK